MKELDQSLLVVCNKKTHKRRDNRNDDDNGSAKKMTGRWGIGGRRYQEPVSERERIGFDGRNNYHMARGVRRGGGYRAEA